VSGVAEADDCHAYGCAEKQFAAAVREGRERRQMTQATLALVMSKGGFRWRQQTVTRAENARRPFFLGEALALSALLGIDLNAIADGADSPLRACDTCRDQPPPGFTCNECGRRAG